MSYCKTCGEFIMNERHKCPPLWLVWDVLKEIDTAREIYAHDSQVAAELWADHRDSFSADYCIAGGSPVTVWVRARSSGVSRRFHVTGGTVHHYRATELKGER